MSITVDPIVKSYRVSACHADRVSTPTWSLPNSDPNIKTDGLGRKIAACLNFVGILSSLMAMVATLVFSVWLSFELLTSFTDQVSSLSPTQLLHALAGM